MNRNEEFYHYNLDPKRIKREKKYYIVWAILVAMFIIFVKMCYSNFPTSKIGGIPVFNLLVWGIIFGHYFIFTLYFGSKMLDLEYEDKMLGLVNENDE